MSEWRNVSQLKLYKIVISVMSDFLKKNSVGLSCVHLFFPCSFCHFLFPYIMKLVIRRNIRDYFL